MAKKVTKKAVVKKASVKETKEKTEPVVPMTTIRDVKQSTANDFKKIVIDLTGNKAGSKKISTADVFDILVKHYQDKSKQTSMAGKLAMNPELIDAMEKQITDLNALLKSNELQPGEIVIQQSAIDHYEQQVIDLEQKLKDLTENPEATVLSNQATQVYENRIVKLEEINKQQSISLQETSKQLETLRSNPPTSQLKEGEVIISKDELVKRFPNWDDTLDFQDNVLKAIETEIKKQFPNLESEVIKMRTELDLCKAKNKELEAKGEGVKLVRNQFVCEIEQKISDLAIELRKKLIDDGHIKATTIDDFPNELANLCIDKWLTQTYKS